MNSDEYIKASVARWRAEGVSEEVIACRVLDLEKRESLRRSLARRMASITGKRKEEEKSEHPEE